MPLSVLGVVSKKNGTKKNTFLRILVRLFFVWFESKKMSKLYDSPAACDKMEQEGLHTCAQSYHAESIPKESDMEVCKMHCLIKSRGDADTYAECERAIFGGERLERQRADYQKCMHIENLVGNLCRNKF